MSEVAPMSGLGRSRAAGLAGLQMGIYSIKLGSTIVLTRLLDPTAFGLISLVGVISAVLIVLTDVGIRQLVISAPNGADQDFLDAAWTLQILRGALVACIVISIAGCLWLYQHLSPGDEQSVYGSPLLPGLLCGCTVSLLLTSLQSTKLFRAERRFDFLALLRLEFINQLVVAMVTVLVAAVLQTVWAFIIGGALGALVQTLLSHRRVYGKPHRLVLSRAPLAQMLGRGKWLIASSAVAAIAYNGDRLILGVMLGPKELGIYSIAFNLITLATAVPARYTGTVTHPMIAHALRQSTAALAITYRGIVKQYDRAMMLFAGAIFSIGPYLTSIVYDTRYHLVGPVLQILSFLVALDRLAIPQQLYISTDRSRNVFVISALGSTSIVVGLTLCYMLGGGLLVAALVVAARNLPAYFYILKQNKALKLLDPVHEVGVWALWPLGALLGAIVPSIWPRAVTTLFTVM